MHTKHLAKILTLDKKHTTMLASPNLTVPLVQYLNTGLNQPHLRGVTGKKKCNVKGMEGNGVYSTSKNVGVP